MCVHLTNINENMGDIKFSLYVHSEIEPDDKNMIMKIKLNTACFKQNACVKIFANVVVSFTNRVTPENVCDEFSPKFI